ncbi:MAG: exodeoxyribonuclease VII small subunit [Firmicutes bacterium]|nr:exodeoxyribonuclease VII small subunit [Bacillota bacterium]
MKETEMITFEDALSRLEELVNKLEEGNLPLEESLDLFEEGIKITKYCSNFLDKAEKRIYLIMENQQGEPLIREEEL